MKRGDVVRYCNRLARQRGVRTEMPVSEARTFARPGDRLAIEASQPEQDRKALVDLALRCERFSFRIGLEDADCPESILMDVTGIAHFLGGEQTLADELAQILRKNSYHVRIAIGNTVGSAWAAAHFLAEPRKPVVIPANEVQLLESLPIAGLRLDEPAKAKFQRLGIQTIRQILNLDRGSLACRFGTHPLIRLDQLTGRQPEPITPCHPPPTYRVKRDLEQGVSQPEFIEQLCSELLRELLDLLAPKQLGTRHLQCTFLLEDQTSELLCVHLRDATNDMDHIGDLLRIKKERLQLASPMIGLHMEATELAPIDPAQQELFSKGNQEARQFSMFVNRLASRLGQDAVLAASIVPTPIPEQAVQWWPATDESSMDRRDYLSRFHALDRPTTLFSRPRPIEVIVVTPEGFPTSFFWNRTRFDITVLSEPERMESGWWDGESICRDYHWVATATGQWLWIFQRLQDRFWFWHGELA